MNNLKQAINLADRGEILKINAVSKDEARSLAYEIHDEWMAREDALDAMVEEQDDHWDVSGWTADTPEEKAVEFRAFVRWS